jgi:hypothetical protein
MKKVNAWLLCFTLVCGFIVLTGCPRPEEPMDETTPGPVMEPIPEPMPYNEFNELNEFNEFNEMNEMNEMNHMEPMEGEPLS